MAIVSGDAQNVCAIAIVGTVLKDATKVKKWTIILKCNELSKKKTFVLSRI